MRAAQVSVALLLVLAACGAGSASSELSVDVRIHHSRFIPDAFTFAVGSSVTFIVHNTDPIDHEFIVGDERVQQRHEDGTEAHHGDKPGEISIPAGETRTTTYTFTEPGRLLIGCHLPTHWDYGMRGSIEVGG